MAVSEIARELYSHSNYPSTARKFGSALKEVNRDRARAAALDKRCDRVENAQITTRSPMQNRRYWVECQNLTRLYFDENSLARDEAVAVQSKTDWLRDGLKDW